MTIAELERIQAERNAERYGYAWLEAERGDLFWRWIGTGKKVLDIGCRDGQLTRWYRAGNEVVGADVDEKALQVATANWRLDGAWRIDLEAEWPWPAEWFDVVVAAEVLEHLRDPEQVVKRAFDVLRPGGVLIGSIPNGYNWRHTVRHVPQSPDHKRRYRYSDLGPLLRPFPKAQIVPIGTLKRVALPTALLRFCDPLVETWAFRCWREDAV